MTEYQPYLDLIDQNYELLCQQADLLQIRGERIVLKLRTSTGEIVAKINTDPVRSAARIERDLRFLNYVTGFGLNCPSLIRTAAGQDWLKMDDFILYLLRFIPGGQPEPSPHFFQRAGQLLGRLHRLPVTSYSDQTDFSLTNELPYIRENQAQVGNWPDGRLRDQLNDTLDHLEAVRPGRQTLIHTDFFNGNMIMRPDGELYLIDLDDAGLGDPLLDLGFFIGNAVLGEVAGAVTFDPADLQQFLRAYTWERPLLAVEIDTLPSYVYFGVILYLCDPWQKRIWLAKVSRYRWLLAHEAWLRQALDPFKAK